MSNVPISGGGSRDWLTPLTPEGHRQSDNPSEGEIRGCHTGHYTGLNGRNCRPGFHYEWLNRNPNSVLTARHRGFQIVNPTDDDAPACMAAMAELQDDSDTPTQLDTSTVFQDVIYARMPIERLRQIKSEDQARANEQIRDGGVSGFLAGASPAEKMTSPDAPTRFARRGHSVTFNDDRGQPESVWTPKSGIVERG